MAFVPPRHRVLAALVPVALTAALAANLDAQAGTPKFIDFWAISSYDYNPKEPYEPAPARAVNTIPPAVRALEGQRVSIAGNAMALDYSSGLMSEFILQASVDACGFGASPRINEWVYVKMAGGQKVRVLTASDMTVTGTFHIREQVEDGRVVGLYTIEADAIQ